MKNLLNIIIEKNPEAQQYREEIERYLKNSGVNEIEFMPIKHALGIALDDRIGDSHTYVSSSDRGFGGYCFPKDTAAILSTSELFNVD
jgi:UDP-glucose 6-dehydrogenase